MKEERNILSPNQHLTADWGLGEVGERYLCPTQNMTTKNDRMVVAASIFTVSTVVGNKVTKTMPATTKKERERKKKKKTPLRNNLSDKNIQLYERAPLASLDTQSTELSIHVASPHLIYISWKEGGRRERNGGGR